MAFFNGKLLIPVVILASLLIACGSGQSENVPTVQQGNVEFTLEIPQGWTTDASKAEVREGMHPALFAGEPFQDFDNSFTAQVEVHYTREVAVPSGYSREEEFELLESYKDGYMGSQTARYKITGGEQADFAGYPALVFTGVDDGTERADFTNKHIAFLADRKLWIFQCRYWPGLDELDNQLGNSCEGIIASVKSK